MIKSKTKINKQLQKKTNPLLVETIISSKKNDKWIEVAGLLSKPKSSWINLNLDEISKNKKAGDIAVIPGKVLSQGEIEKKIKIVAFSFSEKAKEKLSKSKIEFSTILEEIKKNPEAKGIQIMKERLK